MILTRGAMSIKIRGMGPILFLITILPGTLEALTAAKLGKTLFLLPTNLSYTLGFLLAPVGITSIVPILFNFKKKGLGERKHIVQEIMVAATFDNILYSTIFAIMRNLSL
jgi:hypothetical protein